MSVLSLLHAPFRDNISQEVDLRLGPSSLRVFKCEDSSFNGGKHLREMLCMLHSVVTKLNVTSSASAILKDNSIGLFPHFYP